jgi:hypothetical protein
MVEPFGGFREIGQTEGIAQIAQRRIEEASQSIGIRGAAQLHEPPDEARHRVRTRGVLTVLCILENPPHFRSSIAGISGSGWVDPALDRIHSPAKTGP